MENRSAVSFLAVLALVAAQDYQDYQNVRPAPQRLGGPSAPKPTPVPILKQINRHNEDGSYTYGYEGADGSFKIETKLATGEVKGKYGYVDEDGKVRVVEYGANKYGFQPAGEGITVAPPTLVDETTRKDGSVNPEYDDGSYYQPQSATPAPRPQVARVSRPQPRPQPQYQDYDQYEPQQPPQPQYRPAPQPQPQPQYRPAPVPQRAQISGAAPSGIVYSPQPRPARPEPVNSYQAPLARQHSFGSALPAPVRQEPEQLFTQVQPRPAPQQIDFRPAPQPVAYAQPAPRPRPSGGGGGVLDQLARDYALPEGGVPLHDISFGWS